MDEVSEQGSEYDCFERSVQRQGTDVVLLDLFCCRRSDISPSCSAYPVGAQLVRKRRRQETYIQEATRNEPRFDCSKYWEMLSEVAVGAKIAAIAMGPDCYAQKENSVSCRTDLQKKADCRNEPCADQLESVGANVAAAVPCHG